MGEVKWVTVVQVANVRLALVGVLEAALEVPALSNLEEVNRLLMTMTKDSDSDVSRASQYALDKPY